jgi:PEP-CTERM motif
MKTLVFGILCLFTISLYSPLSALQLGNSGADWTNFNGAFPTPFTNAPGETRSVGNMGGPMDVEILISPSPDSILDVSANGGAPAVQLNAIPLNSLFVKPGKSIPGSTVFYSLFINPQVGAQPQLSAGSPFYMYSIARFAGESTQVRMEVIDTSFNLVTQFSSSEIDVLGPTLVADNALSSLGGYTTVVTNAGADGTNTKPIAFTFGVDVGVIRLDILAIDANGVGGYDGFNFGMAVPEPSTYLLMGSSLAGILFLASRRKRAVK